MVASSRCVGDVGDSLVLPAGPLHRTRARAGRECRAGNDSSRHSPLAGDREVQEPDRLEEPVSSIHVRRWNGQCTFNLRQLTPQWTRQQPRPDHRSPPAHHQPALATGRSSRLPTALGVRGTATCQRADSSPFDQSFSATSSLLLRTQASVTVISTRRLRCGPKSFTSSHSARFADLVDSTLDSHSPAQLRVDRLVRFLGSTKALTMYAASSSASSVR
jgi:hypothetical protein